MLTNCPKLQASPTVPSFPPVQWTFVISGISGSDADRVGGKRASIGLILFSFLFLSLYYSTEGHRVYLAHPGPKAAGAPVCSEVHNK